MKLILKAKQQIAENIYSYTFSSKEPISWVAGQSIRLEIDGLYGTEERRFTISSAPYEGDITITTQVSNSDFKRALHDLQLQEEIDAFSIEGNFVWHKEKPALFIARGMGITPFISMLRQISYEKDEDQEIALIYSSKQGRILFEEELSRLQKNMKLRLEYIFDTKISADFIKKVSPVLSDKTIYISGSSNMVDETSKVLIEACDVKESQLKRDWFIGLA